MEVQSNAKGSGLPLLQTFPERVLGFLFNVAVIAVFQIGCVLTVGGKLRGVSPFIIPAAIISQAAFLSLYPACLAIACTMRCSIKTMRLISGCLFGLFQCIYLTDLAQFRVFGMHFLKLSTFQILTTPGVGDVLRPGKGTVICMLILYAVTITFCLYVVTRAIPKLLEGKFPRRFTKIALILILGSAVVERTVLELRSLQDPRPLDSMEDTFTFYIPLDLASLVKKWKPNCKPVGTWDLPVWNVSGKLDLPKNPLGPAKPTHQPNVLVIAIESARADGLTPTSMPNVSRFAEESWRLDRHFSTGCETPLGCFGLFYSLSCNYRGPIREEKKTSPAVDYFKKQNYEFRLFSAAGLDYTELPATAFRELTNDIKDKWNCDHVSRDQRMTDTFIDFLGKRQTGRDAKPFFGFLFFDASHLPYDYPPEDAVLEFSLKPGEVNYALLGANPGASSRFKNCYLNSLHYVDRQIERILQQLRESGEYNNTVVVICGDHGEEFGECGRYAHLDGLNRFQSQTLAVMHLPGESARVVTNLTSHVDFFPTILTWMGVTNAPSDYSTGVPINSPQPRQFVVLNDFRGAVTLVKKGSFTVFRRRGVSYQTPEEQDLEDDALRPTAEDVAELVQKYNSFLK